MRTLRVVLLGLCLVGLSGCWLHHRPLLAHRFHCCPPPPCCPPVPHCAAYLGGPVPATMEPPPFIAPQPKK